MQIMTKQHISQQVMDKMWVKYAQKQNEVYLQALVFVFQKSRVSI